MSVTTRDHEFVPTEQIWTYQDGVVLTRTSRAQGRPDEIFTAQTSGSCAWIDFSTVPR